MTNFKMTYLSYSRHHGPDSQIVLNVESPSLNDAQAAGRDVLKERFGFSHTDYFLSKHKKAA